MGTVSTLPTVKAALITKLTPALGALGGIQVSYAWPGPNTDPESVFCGRLPFEGPLPPSEILRSEIAGIKTGRKQRQEEYVIPVTFHSFRPDLTVQDAATAEARAFLFLSKLEDVLADDPRLGLATLVQWAALGDVEIVAGSPIPWETGWLSLLVADVVVHARLT